MLTILLTVRFSSSSVPEPSPEISVKIFRLPYPEVMISEGSDFLRSYEITLSLAEKGREATGLDINVAVGPYPVLLIPLAERFGLDKAEKMLIECILMLTYEVLLKSAYNCEESPTPSFMSREGRQQ